MAPKPATASNAPRGSPGTTTASGKPGKEAGADPTSPMENVDAQVDELQALVRQSREEQAVISSKILALKNGGLSNTPAGLRGPGGGFGTPGPSNEEVMSLRSQLADTDSMLLEKDAEVERLRSQVRALLVQVEEPKTGAAWRHRYEDSQKKLEASVKDYQGLMVEGAQKQKEIVNLSSYLRILEVDQSVNSTQRERLLSDQKTCREKLRVLQVERDSLGRSLRSLEEGFLRCIGRITQSLAAGVATVMMDDVGAEARFVVLRVGTDGHGVIEIFREPDGSEEIMAFDIAPPGATVTANREAMNIQLTGSLGVGMLRLCCISLEEYMKWIGALRLVGFPLTDALPRR